MAHDHSARSLDHYNEVSLYDLAFKARKYDIDFFLRRAAELTPEGRILEWGAGSGRVTVPLARAGRQVVAVDASPSMLERLERRLSRAPRKVRQRVELKRGDMRKVRLKERFPLVLATFNVVAHLESYRDMGAFLRNAADHLEPGGRLIFDVPIPSPEEVEADPDELHPVPRFKHPDTGEWIHQTERFEYDAARQVLLVESEFRAAKSRDPFIVPLTLRQWFPKEVEAALFYEGFSSIQSYADYSDQPGILARDTLIFSATCPDRQR